MTGSEANAKQQQRSLAHQLASIGQHARALRFDADVADSDAEEEEHGDMLLNGVDYESDEEDHDGDDGDDGDVDEEEEAAFAMMNQLHLLQTRNARNSRAAGGHAPTHKYGKTEVSSAAKSASSVSAGMELKQAEERIAKLEAQLLDAEETICHLKAEKLEALRDVEKLTIALEDHTHSNNHAGKRNTPYGEANKKSVGIWGAHRSASDDGGAEHEQPEQHDDCSGEDSVDEGDADDNNNNGEENANTQSVKELRAHVQELQERLKNQQNGHVVEQEERMAVIREQELELRQVKLELDAMTEKYEELEARHDAALEGEERYRHSSTSSSSRHGGASVAHQYDSDQDEDEFLHRNLDLSTGLKDRSSSLDSMSFGRVSENGSSNGLAGTGGGARMEHHRLQWREELVRHPTPHFDLDSPEVHYLLHSWTTNVQKLQYLRMWFTQVAITRGALPRDFPLGVELPRLSPEIRDGFLTLVVPLLRKQTQRDIQVHSRQYNDQYHTDVRIRAIPRT